MVSPVFMGFLCRCAAMRRRRMERPRNGVNCRMSDIERLSTFRQSASAAAALGYPQSAGVADSNTRPDNRHRLSDRADSRPLMSAGRVAAPSAEAALLSSLRLQSFDPRAMRVTLQDG